MATDIKQENFDTFISQSDKPVLVDFWATWCGPCRMLSPVVEEVSREHENELTVGKVNVDDCPELAQKFRLVGEIERHHEERYRALLRNVETAKVFEKSEVKVWECRNCGHIVVGTKAPDVCPTCNHPQSYFEVHAENY